MDTFGQWGPISVLPNYESTGIFTMNRIKSLDKPNKSCESEDEYSYTECLRRYVTRTSNCSIDILANKYNCTPEGFVKLLDTLNELRTMTKYDTSKTTGCLQKCTVHKYTFQSENVDEATWRKDWLSSFYLSARKTTYQISEENYSYDEQVDVYGLTSGPDISDCLLLLGPDWSYWRLPRSFPRLVCDDLGICSSSMDTTGTRGHVEQRNIILKCISN